MTRYWINNLGETSKGGGRETGAERRVSLAWARLSPVTDDLFRVQGRIRENVAGEVISEITLTTELVERCARPTFWNKVYQFTLDTGARIEWEHTCKADEHSWKVDATRQKIEGSDEYGPDHGKLLRQVGIVWLFPLDISRRELEQFRTNMFQLMRKPFGKRWVSVL